MTPCSDVKSAPSTLNWVTMTMAYAEARMPTNAPLKMKRCTNWDFGASIIAIHAMGAAPLAIWNAVSGVMISFLP